MDSDQKDNSAPGAGKEEGAAAEGTSGGFEVTEGRLEQLMKSMEVLLSEVEQLRAGCSHQAAELITTTTELLRQQEDIKESYAGLGRDMQEVVDTMDELLSTKSAIDDRERQAKKLNRQLWGWG